jgi:hypothetical protein
MTQGQEMVTAINADQVRFIKLGSRGWGWEKTCIDTQTLRLSYRDVPHDLCTAGQWQEIRAWYIQHGTSPGAATRHVNQLRDFYATSSKLLWITFYGDCMYWCFADASVTRLDDGTSVRKAIDGWKNTDINGRRLTKSQLSGGLLAVQGFRGTICSVKSSYALHKINGTNPPQVEKAKQSLMGLESALLPIVGQLQWRDFELLVDLIFRNNGFNRIGDLGKTEKDIDLALESAITGDLFAVQVKSAATLEQYNSYRERYNAMVGFERFYFVTNVAIDAVEKDSLLREDKKFNYWGPNEIVRLALRSGLAQWLLDKAY